MSKSLENYYREVGEEPLPPDFEDRLRGKLFHQPSPVWVLVPAAVAIALLWLCTIAPGSSARGEDALVNNGRRDTRLVLLMGRGAVE